MKKRDIAVYHETLSSALDEVDRFATAERSEINQKQFSESGWRDHFSVNYHLEREQCGNRHYELTAHRGKPTKKWLHITVYRLASGRYELTVYIL